MPTQIVATPVVTGKSAEIILREMQKKPSVLSEIGARLLVAKFEKITRK